MTSNQSIDADKAQALVTELRKRAMRPISYTATTAYINAAKELKRLIPEPSRPTRVEITAGDDTATVETLMDAIEQIEGITIRVINHAVPVEEESTASTMAEIEWDDDQHHLAEAEHRDGSVVTMLVPAVGDPLWVHVHDHDSRGARLSHASNLTPIDRRRRLVPEQPSEEIDRLVVATSLEWIQDQPAITHLDVAGYDCAIPVSLYKEFGEWLIAKHHERTAPRREEA